LKEFSRQQFSEKQERTTVAVQLLHRSGLQSVRLLDVMSKAKSYDETSQNSLVQLDGWQLLLQAEHVTVLEVLSKKIVRRLETLTREHELFI
jgi:hypothetical protein